MPLVNGQLHLYGDVGDPWGFGEGFTPLDVAQDLAAYGPSDIVVRINSGGGIAADGMAISSLLMAHTGRVTTVVDGIAASAASLIALAGDVRQMRKGAMLMIHDPATIAWGNAASLKKTADVLDKLADNYADVYASVSGGDRAAMRALMLEETWLTADEAIAQKFADAVVADEVKNFAAFDYRIYARAPGHLPARKRRLHAAANQTAAAGLTAAARMRMRARHMINR